MRTIDTYHIANTLRTESTSHVGNPAKQSVSDWSTIYVLPGTRPTIRHRCLATRSTYAIFRFSRSRLVHTILWNLANLYIYFLCCGRDPGSYPPRRLGGEVGGGAPLRYMAAPYPPLKQCLWVCTIYSKARLQGYAGQ